MRTKADTVALYRDAFLLGKDEQKVKDFDERSLEKQYTAIMNWKRNQKKKAAKEGLKPTVKEVLNHIKAANNKIKNLVAMTPQESQKLNDAIEGLKGVVADYEKNKKQLLINELRAQKMKLDSEGQNLERKIAELEQQL